MGYAIVIPSLDPDVGFIKMVRDLSPSIDMPVIVVNDGSDKSLLYIFEEISKIKNCHVLHHSKNFGKGRALKTAFEFFYEHFSNFDGVVTADSDGQHSLNDIANIASQINPNIREIILGTRNFKDPSVPFRSWFGNSASTIIFRILYGQKIMDTQTGLRGIPISIIPFLLDISGERFDYEINTLVQCSRNGIKIRSIPIETIYINENSGSHFQPLRDSAQNIKMLLGGLSHYAASSVVSAITDVVLFITFNALILKDLPPALRILLATSISRFLSSVCNYLMNKVAFRNQGNIVSSAFRYYVLWTFQLILSFFLTYLTSTFLHLNANVSKPFIDIFLAIISYQIQMKWVFKHSNEE